MMKNLTKRTMWGVAIIAAIAIVSFSIHSALAVFGFTNVTSTAGLADTGSNTGHVLWSDVDNDGDPDIFFNGPNVNNRQLFRNNGNGTFTASTTFTGGRDVKFGDYDNDGYRDLFLNGSILFHNDSGAGWTQNTTHGMTNSNAEGAGWLDYNKDGWLDAIHPDGTNGSPNLWKNNGNATFTNVTSSALGSTTFANGEWVLVGDYDNDGDVDIFYGQGQGGGGLDLMKNNGNATFTVVQNVASLSGSKENCFSLGDYDNDGDFDLIVAQGTTNALFRTNADGTFTNVSATAGDIGTVSATSSGTAWGDFDHDGDLDLYVVNLSAADSFFRNNGNGTFTEIGSTLGISNTGSTSESGAATSDYDLDGDLDIFVNNGGTATTVIYRNDLNDTNYLKVKVTGAGAGYSPKDGTGSIVELYDSTGTTRLAVREVSGGKALGQDEPIVHFGLAAGWGGGSETYIVRVKFTSGKVVSRTVVPANEKIRVGSTVLNQTIEIEEETIIVQKGTGSSTSDFKLIFKEIDAGTSEGYKGTVTVWSTNYLSATELLTELDQDTDYEVDKTSMLELLESTPTRTILENKFTLGLEATVTEKYTVNPKGKIYKGIEYKKDSAGTEARRVDDGAVDFVATGMNGYYGATPSTTRATGTYYDYQLMDIIGTTTAEITDYKNPDILDFSPGAAVSGDEAYYEAETSPGLKFDGVDDKVVIGDPANLAFTGSHTVETWAKIVDASIEPNFLGKGGAAGARDKHLSYETDGVSIKFAYAVSPDLSLTVRRFSATTAASRLNLWTHIAAVYTSGASPSLDIYINGVLDNGTLSGTIPTSISDNSLNWQIGTRGNDVGFFKGPIDDVRIWNVARSQADIQANMYKELTGTETGLVSYWKFNEGTGQTANDSKGTNHGTLGSLATADANDPTWATGYQGDGFNEAEGAYTVTAGGTYTTGTPQAVFDLDGLTYTRYNPVFKLRQFTSFTDPTYYIESGAAKTNGTDYNADLIPFTDAYFMNDTAGAPTMTDLAQGGDTADASEKLSSTSQDQTLTLDEAALTPNNSTPDGDAIYFGSHQKFSGINIDLDTLGAGGAGEWQFWDGDSWNDITVSETVTNASKFYADGAIYWQDTNVLGWQKTAAPLGDETGCVGYWDFNEGTGTTITDRSGTANTGTLTIGATGSQTTTAAAWTNGASGRSSGAMNFDGTDDQVSLGTITNLLNTNGSFSTWFKSNATPTANEYITSTPLTHALSVYIDISNNIHALYNQTEFANLSGLVKQNTWHHVAVTWDVGTNTQRFYFDGVQKATGSIASTSASGATIVGRWHGGGPGFNGLIDEVRIFNTSRTAAQIKADYERGRQYYYTRFVATTAYTTNPVENLIKTDLMVVQDLTNVFDTAASDTVFINTLPTQLPSAPSSLSPAAGAWTNDNTPTLSFTQSDPDVGDTVKYRIQIDDTVDFSSVVVDYTSALIAQGATSFTVGQAGTYTVGSAGQTLTDSANYYWRVMSTDNNNASSSWATANAGAIAFKIDTTAPTITSPTITEISAYLHPSGTTLYYSDGMGITAQNADFNGTASDAGAGLSQATFSTAFGDSPAADATPATWSGVYTVVAADTGAQTLTVTVSDNAGNIATATINGVEDITVPTITSPTITETSSYLYLSGTTLYYSDGMGVTAQNADFNGTSSDAGAGPYQATFSTAFGDSPGADATPATWSGVYTVVAADTGAQTLTVTISDNVGNTAVSTINGVEDITSPTITSPTITETSAYLYLSGTTLYYSDGMGVTAQNADFNGTSSDAGAGLYQATFSTAFGDSPTADATPATWSGVYTIINTDTGTQTLTATISDNVGNSAQSSITCYEDVTAPTAGTLSVTESSSYLYVSGANFYYSAQMGATDQTATFSVAGASDAGSGLQYITFPAFFGEGAINDSTDPYSEPYLISNLDTSTGAFTAATVDNAGNSANTNSITVVKDVTAPGTPAAPTFGTITTTSIVINKPADPTETESGLYQWQARRGGATNLGWQALGTTIYTDSPLTPNIQYTYDVQFSDNVANASSFSTGSSKYTLANSPTASAFSNITGTSIQANWGANNNAAGTQYYVEYDTGTTFVASEGASGWITDTYWNVVGLSTNTPYSFRVKAKNGENIETDWTSLSYATTGVSAVQALEYELRWSTDYNFGTATTKASVNYPTDAGWTAATFTSGASVTYTVQAADALTNGTTYWWQIRVRDPSGSNTWSSWTTARSFTIDTTVTAPTWFQTTKEQFDTDTAAGSVAPQAGTNDVRMTTP